MFATPNKAPGGRRCATCAHFGHWISDGHHAWCLHGRIVIAQPQNGCSYWMREIGADDDLTPSGSRLDSTD